MKCPICAETYFSEWGKVQAYSILKCRACGIGLTAPFPTKEQLAELNSKNYPLEQRIQTYMSRQDYFERRYKKYVANIKQVITDGCLLDVGCNIGLFMKVAREAGYAVKGVELNENCAAYGRKEFHLDIYSKYLEDIAFPDETFDVITLFDILEHIPDIGSFVDELKRILKRNGLVVIQSPNFSSLMAELTKSDWHWLTPPDHLYHFTPETLVRFLESRGFGIKEIKTWEPAEEFSNNLIATFRIGGFIGAASRTLLRITGIVFAPTLLLQKIWWRKGKGGLVEVYAIKAQS